MARNLLRIIDQLPAGYGIGVLCAWISPQSKRLGDYVAGTVVVHEKLLESVSAQWTAPMQPGMHQFYANRLTPEEFALIETFLSRRNSLEPGVRYDMAAGIVRQIESKLVLPPDRPPAEKLLEEIADERRSNAGCHAEALTAQMATPAHLQLHGQIPELHDAADPGRLVFDGVS